MKSATFEHENGVKNGADEHLQRIFRLENVNLTVKKGDVICLEGPVGGGKSAFIDAIVASVNCTSGSVCVHELTSGFGYVPQTPWLQRGTIRDKIIWGNVFDEQWYKAILYACALNEDLELLGGDLIGIGENGRTLSGGQRARVALARAVYQNKKIYLLDDILASLDAHVARHIIRILYTWSVEGEDTHCGDTQCIVILSRTSDTPYRGWQGDTKPIYVRKC
ncbi:multidrug resistance-associated protein 7-like [Rhagoletis pomonella]|uniref:multidrug resistance-associated protein 7-like n=1 Tax=Rhagoletis pomonella TaxID=28610 RepID=UPI001781650E|nr:multidrug resistance-associated protein 7-like [Rhagoletis pomonella]